MIIMIKVKGQTTLSLNLHVRRAEWRFTCTDEKERKPKITTLQSTHRERAENSGGRSTCCVFTSSGGAGCCLGGSGPRGRNRGHGGVGHLSWCWNLRAASFCHSYTRRGALRRRVRLCGFLLCLTICLNRCSFIFSSHCHRPLTGWRRRRWRMRRWMMRRRCWRLQHVLQSSS